MNPPSINPDDLALLACDELPAEEAARLRAALAGDATAAAEARGLAVAVAALKQQGDAPVSEGFARTLRQRWQSELAAERPAAQTPATAVPRRAWRWSWGLAAAAAVLAAILLWPAPTGNGSGQVAWAEVVQALSRVEQFRVTLFADEPHKARAPQMYRVDVFYRAPDRWRAQGAGHVQFEHAGESRLYNIAQGRFIDRSEADISLIPPGVTRRMESNALLPAILDTLFDGKAPPGEPVKSDRALAGEGLEVFDYAVDAKQKWARIWVLKQSRLPVRANVYYPGSNDFLLVVFDYSDPQPEGFFDAGQFDKTVREKGLREPAQVYGAGMEPVSGARPRDAAQIHEVAGGYKAPTIREVIADDKGNLLLITDVPTNRTPAGAHPIGEGYERVRDSWGNEYGQVTWLSSGGVKRWCYTPIGVFCPGDGPRTLTLDYTVTVQDPVKVHATTTLKHERLPGLTVTPTDKLPANWAQHFAPGQRYSGLHALLEQRGTLAEQLAAVERWLAEEPDGLDALLWQAALMRQHGRAEAAWRLFEAQCRERLLADGPGLAGNHRRADMLGHYLFDRAAAGQVGQIEPIVSRLGEIKEQALASTNRGVRDSAQYVFESEHSLLRNAMRIPAALRAFAEAPKPQLVRAVAGRDGHACVVLRLPAPPTDWKPDGSGGAEAAMMYWLPHAPPGAWSLRATHFDAAAGEWWAVYAGAGAKLPLGGTVTLLRDRYAGGKSITGQWSLDVEVPAATVDDLRDWWSRNTPGHRAPWWQPPATQPAAPAALWLAQGLEAVGKGEHALALRLFEQAAGASDEQWPADYRHPANAGLLEKERRHSAVGVVKSLAQLGRLDEAERAVAALEVRLPPKPDLEDPQDLEQRQALGSARLAIVRQLIAWRRLDEAQAMMRLMERERPRLREVVPYHDVMVSTARPGRGMDRWWFGWRHRDAWREFDVVWWDLRDALGGR